ILSIEQAHKLIDEISNFDGVVLNDLNNVKIDLIEKIDNTRVKIFLRLFGYELYSQLKHKYLSKATLNYSVPISINKLGYFNFFKRKIKRFLGIEYKI